MGLHFISHRGDDTIFAAESFISSQVNREREREFGEGFGRQLLKSFFNEEKYSTNIYDSLFHIQIDHPLYLFLMGHNNFAMKPLTFLLGLCPRGVLLSLNSQ